MAVSVRDVIARVRRVMHDEVEPYRWTDGELIEWLNDAASEVVIIRPAAGARTETVELDEGAYQAIPAEGIQLMDVVRNIKPDDKPGRPIRRTDRRLLDSAEPTWYERKPASSVRHFTFDDRNPKAFYCYPPAEQGLRVEILYSAPPEPVDSVNDTLGMDRAYIGPLVSYILYRAMSKDFEFGGGALAAAHQQAFMTAMGVQNDVALAVSPRGPIDEAT